MVIKSTKVLIALICFSISISKSAQAQRTKKSLLSISLEDQLNAKDSILFDAVFHSCNMPTVESLFSPGFEYYQDKGDQQQASVTSREEFIGNIKRKCERA